MQAIIDAGGAGGKVKLRSAATRKTESKRDKQNTQQRESGGDLLSDLAANLARRRQGMTGAGKAGGGGNDSGLPRGGSKSALDRLSEIIPPPPPKAGGASAARDDDWN